MGEHIAERPPGHVPGWQEMTGPLVAARPTAELRGLFGRMHADAEQAAAALADGPTRVLAACSADLHAGVREPVPQVGPVRALVDVVLTDEDLFLIGTDGRASPRVVLDRHPLSTVRGLEAGPVRRGRWRKLFALWLQTERDDTWHALVPPSETDAAALHDRLRAAVEAARR